MGIPLRSQLVLTSHAQSSSAHITLKQVRIAFEGGLKNIQLDHLGDDIAPARAFGPKIAIQDISLHKPTSNDGYVSLSPVSPTKTDSLHGSADLTLTADSSKAFCLTDIPRNAGEAEVSSIILIVQEDDFDLEILITEDKYIQRDYFVFQDNSTSILKNSARGRSSAVRIAAKPPKLRLDLSGQADALFIDELLMLAIDVVNDEEEEVDVTLDARFMGSSDTAPSMKWSEGHEVHKPPQAMDFEASPSMQRELGSLAQSGSQMHKMHLKAPSQPTDCTLEIRARYYLKSEPETPISKAVTRLLSFSTPFEAISTFSPVISTVPWPDYFDVNTVADNEVARSNEERRACGLTQTWSILSRITSLATLPVMLEKIELQVLEAPGDVQVASVSVDRSLPKALSPAALQECHFSLSAQKLDLEERRSSFLDLHLVVEWRREGSSGSPTITLLPVPELVVPFGEPRVLASAQTGTSPPGVVHLSYMIENPSSYTLTFSITMETSEEFAFSGAKSITVQLVPTSRQSVHYNLMPLVKGVWINPQLKVYDTQFHKTLRIQATDSMRNDKKGVSIWVDSDG